MAAVITQEPGSSDSAVIAWGGLEAENDMRLLEADKKVALLKARSNWALDLEGVIDYSIEGVVKEKEVKGFIEPPSSNGIDYEDYLRVLLFFQNRESKLLRAMDLIQLNMKANYHRDFALQDYYEGFNFEVTVNDQKYLFSHQY